MPLERAVASPFEFPDELAPKPVPPPASPSAPPSHATAPPPAPGAPAAAPPATEPEAKLPERIEILVTGVRERLIQVPLPPGTYVVDVNRTQRTVTVEAGRKVVLRTGDLVVRGQPESAYWYPLQGQVRTLSANPPLLNRARALLPGTYTVFVHTSVTVPDRDLGAAEVVAGRTTALEH